MRNWLLPDVLFNLKLDFQYDSEYIYYIYWISAAWQFERLRTVLFLMKIHNNTGRRCHNEKELFNTGN